MLVNYCTIPNKLKLSTHSMSECAKAQDWNINYIIGHTEDYEFRFSII